MEQRRRELQEERELETLRRLQGKSSRSEQYVIPSPSPFPILCCVLTSFLTQNRPNALDWMYKTPVELKDDRVQDDYLLGKRMPEQKSDNVITQVQQAPGALFVKTTPIATSVADMKAKLRDDPLMLIKAREAEHLRNMSATQAQLHRIREEELEDDHRRHRERSRDSSKHKHKHKDKHRHHKHGGDSSDEHEDGEERRRHKKRHREEQEETSHVKRPKYEDGQHRRDESQREERPVTERNAEDGSTSRDEKRREERVSDGRVSEHGGAHAYHEWSRHAYESHEPYERRGHVRDGGGHAEYRRESDGRHPSRYEERGRPSPYDDRRGSGRAYDHPSSYSHSGGPNGSSSTSSYRQQDHHQHRRGMPEMTDEERDRMLSQMQQGAKQLQETRSTQIQGRRAEDEREKAEYLRRGQSSSSSSEIGAQMPSFVVDMNKEALRSNSMEDVVSRSRFYLQRGD